MPGGILASKPVADENLTPDRCRYRRVIGKQRALPVVNRCVTVGNGREGRGSGRRSSALLPSLPSPPLHPFRVVAIKPFFHEPHDDFGEISAWDLVREKRPKAIELDSLLLGEV